MATRKRPDPIAEHVASLREQLAARGNPARAVHEKRYLKSELEFLGVGVPGVRKVAKDFVRAHPELDRAQVLQLAEALWRHEVHELRAVAVGIRLNALRATSKPAPKTGTRRPRSRPS